MAVKGIPTPLPRRRKPRRGHVWLLRFCNHRLQGYSGFQYPATGDVEAPDWNPAAVCGWGLHAWDISDPNCGFAAKEIEQGSRFQVVEVRRREIVHLHGKVKFPRCRVMYTGTCQQAVQLIEESGSPLRAFFKYAPAWYPWLCFVATHRGELRWRVNSPESAPPGGAVWRLTSVGWWRWLDFRSLPRRPPSRIEDFTPRPAIGWREHSDRE